MTLNNKDYFEKLPNILLTPTYSDMESLPNLNVFLRGWQAYLPFLY